MREELKKPLLEIVRLIGIALAVYLAIRWLLPLAIPFLLAFLLAKLLHPVVDRLHRKIKLKRGVLSWIVLLFFLAVAGVILWVIGKNLFLQLQNILHDLPVFQDKAIGLWNNCCEQMENWTGINAETLDYKVQSALPQLWENIKGNVLPALMSGSFSWAKGVFVFVSICFITLISTILILKDYEKIRAAMQKGYLGKTSLGVLHRVYRAGGCYLKAQLIIMIIVSIFCVVGLFMAGNPYALAAGMGVGICDALPFLGTGTIFIPWALLELLQGKYMAAVIYIIIYTICSIVRELLEPKLVGDRLGIPPLLVIVSIYAGLCIYGLWGFALGPLSYILIKEIWAEVKGG